MLTYFNYLNEVATFAFVVTCNVLLSSMHFVTGRRDGISEHPKLVLSRSYQSNSPDHHEFSILSQNARAHFRHSIINNYGRVTTYGPRYDKNSFLLNSLWRDVIVLCKIEVSIFTFMQLLLLLYCSLARVRRILVNFKNRCNKVNFFNCP